jgi:uncharacterized membrane protein YphA (DoxX/SURF4 family)
MKKTLNHTVIPWFVLAASLVLGVVCAFVTEFNWNFLVALLLVFTLAIFYRNNFDKSIVIIVRTLLGAVFLFSGFVKGVDPLGTQYQIFDYFAAYGMMWANPLAKLIAVCMIAAEMVVGVALILNLRMMFTAWVVAAMMLFFTTTTLLDATIFSDRITDCGCFGKAIVLTNWQTFFKNLVLNIWVVILFFGRYRVRNTFSLLNEFIIAMLAAILFFTFQFYNLRYLPVIDFLDWKVGAKLNPPKTEPITFTYVYKNIETQEIIEFEWADRPEDLLENWTYVDLKIHDPNPPNLMIPIFDNNTDEGHDVSNWVADNPGYFFIVAIHDLDKTNFRNIPKIFALMDFANQNKHEFIFLFDLNTNQESIENFKQRTGRSDFNIFFSDDKSIKAIVRSNPGLILLHDGYVRNKWAWRDIPSVEEMKKFMNKK